MKTFEELFPFEYQGGGYFRRKGISKGQKAEILHGEEAVRFMYELQKGLTSPKEPVIVSPTIKEIYE